MTKKIIISFLKIGMHGPLFEKTWILFTQECFVRSFVEIGPVVLEIEEDENMKSLQQQQQQQQQKTDKFPSEKLSVQVSS